MSTGRFTISKRFRGPKDSGNGGYFAGCFARFMDFELARVTLLLPPPLEEELIVEKGERGMVARKGDGTVVAACSQGEIDLDVPPVPSLEAARQASARFIMADDHFFPECFVCGTERADDGLCIHPGQLEASETVATHWKPDASVSRGNGVVDAEIVWAALDCPGGIACLGREIRPIVLGKMCAEIREPVPTGEDLIVMGWPVATDGAKEHVGTAIARADGRILAVAAATWIVLSDEQSSFSVSKK